MPDYLIRNERRKYPVQEDEFSYITQEFDGDSILFYPSNPAKKISPYEAIINPEWKAIQRPEGNTLILYSERYRIQFIRTSYTIRYKPYPFTPKVVQVIEPSVDTKTWSRRIEFVTCGLCLCDHDILFCKRIQSKMVCMECRHELAYAKATASVADYAARKRLATPKWADLDAIEAIYTEARIRTLKTGIQHHVDHIIPIRGKTASGLHCEFNLQILTAQDNLKKSNKLI